MPMESEIPPPSSRSFSSGESASSCESSKSSDESLHSSSTSELSIDEEDLVTGSSDTQPQSNSVDGDNVESTSTSVHSPNLDPTSVNAGYKIVFDNLDKTVKPRYIRSDAQAQSLHYVQGFAMKDRIDYSCFSEKLDNGEVNLYMFYQILKTISY